MKQPNHGLDEGEAIRLSRDGQPHRFRTLVELYQRRVLSLCYRMVGRWHEAEDLAQQSFVDAFMRLDTFEIGRPFWPWICRIAVNNCKDYLKSRKRAELPCDPSLLPEPGVRDGASDPESIELRREREKLLMRALQALPTKYRVVLLLKDVEDMAYTEIENILGLPITTLKMRVIRARKKMAREIEALNKNGDEVFP